MLDGLLASFDLQAWLTFVPIVAFAAVVYSAVGFGAGIVAVPIATQFYDLRFTIAVLAIVELVNSIRLVLSQRGEIVVSEARVLIVTSILGTGLGMALLVIMPTRWLMIALALFIVAYLLSLRLNGPGRDRAAPGWAYPAGFVAGVCSAMFGAGGPPYAIYLRMRQLGMAKFRATMGMVGMFNLSSRVIGFTVLGLYFAPRTLITGLALLPVSILATLITERFRNRVPVGLLTRLTSIILAIAAVSLIWRAAQLPG